MLDTRASHQMMLAPSVDRAASAACWNKWVPMPRFWCIRSQANLRKRADFLWESLSFPHTTRCCSGKGSSNNEMTAMGFSCCGTKAPKWRPLSSSTRRRSANERLGHKMDWRSSKVASTSMGAIRKTKFGFTKAQQMRYYFPWNTLKIHLHFLFGRTYQRVTS